MKAVGSRILRGALVALLGLSGVLLFLLASASANTGFFERHYSWLLALNVMLALGMFGLVIVLAQRLWRRYKAGVFGTRMMLRLALFFTLVGVLPGVFVYVVSAQFLSKSIETWFNVRVDSALESGLTLGRDAIDSMLTELKQKAEVMARELAQQPRDTYGTLLNRLRVQAGVADALIINSTGQMLASAGDSFSLLLPDVPSSSILRQVRTTRAYAQVEGELDNSSMPTGKAAEADSTNLRLRVVLAIPKNMALDWRGEGESLYLQLLQEVPASLASNAMAVESVYRDYEALSLSRNGLRKIYLATLTLTLLLTIAAALAGAFILSNWFAAPLFLLAEGTKAIAAGDFARVNELADRGGQDELGVLTQQFRAMTKQLEEARQGMERNRAALEKSKTFLESILGNLSAGVLVFDTDFRLTTYNQSAVKILGQAMENMASAAHPSEAGNLAELEPLLNILRHNFTEQQMAGEEDGGTTLPWQKQIDFAELDLVRHPDAPTPVLLVRGSRLPVGEGFGYVVVFDDITQVISGQRALAWGEVARRLAHEIKNPLTPIQLAAERLQMKLIGKVDEVIAEMVNKTTGTIVNQVAALKRMVDDFRDYARTPPAVLQPLDLNGLILDILQLYASAKGGGRIDTTHFRAGPIEAELMQDLPPIQGDPTQLRQVIHNLLQNALDATETRETPLIQLRTRLRASESSPGETRVQLVIIDNGPGFSAGLLKRAFEPYVTTKAKGTGLGLPLVKKILDEHGAQIELQNRLQLNESDEPAEKGSETTPTVIGAQVRIVFKKLAEPAS